MAWLAGGCGFAVLATANAAGYRYGVSDQAFYIPVVLRALDPAAFPRDATLIDAQGRLMLADELIAAVIKATGIPLDVLFLLMYLLSVALIWLALSLVGAKVYRSAWMTVALGAALTLRHRIPRTSANSFEPYFHPRMLAFSLGALAIASVLHRRFWIAIALVAASALVHITTALWFAVLVGVALAVLDARMRRLAILATAAVVAIGTWVLIAGPINASMTVMDETWLQAVASKDSLFPSQWPIWAWVANLGMVALLAWSQWRRRQHGHGRAEDTALSYGAIALAAVFLITLPAVTAGLALPVQLQISRVFWLVDLLATVYLLALVDRHRTAQFAAAALLLVSLGRGMYVMLVERPERALFSVHLTDSPWEDAMLWLGRQPIDTHVLADPGHAWKYGTSIRVSAGRDVFIEEVKDSAVAIYSRDVAARVVERTAELGDFSKITPEHARALSSRYGIDYLVTEVDLPLPLAYRNERFRIYGLSNPH